MVEPRTSSIAQRFKAVETLSKAGIPVKVNIAPVIPGLTDHDNPCFLVLHLKDCPKTPPDKTTN